MPGVPELVAELGVDPKTASLALSILVEEGLLISQGLGRQRRIELTSGLIAPALRVSILAYEEINRKLSYMVDLQHMLAESDNIVSFAPKTMLDVGMGLTSISRLAGSQRCGCLGSDQCPA
jgi:hypothetical protein